MKIGILGLGYVGIQLAAAFCRKHETVGFDPNETKLDAYRFGIDPSGQVTSTQFQSATSLTVTSNRNDLKGCHIYIEYFIIDFLWLYCDRIGHMYNIAD